MLVVLAVLDAVQTRPRDGCDFDGPAKLFGVVRQDDVERACRSLLVQFDVPGSGPAFDLVDVQRVERPRSCRLFCGRSRALVRNGAPWPGRWAADVRGVVRLPDEARTGTPRTPPLRPRSPSASRRRTAGCRRAAVRAPGGVGAACWGGWRATVREGRRKGTPARTSTRTWPSTPVPCRAASARPGPPTTPARTTGTAASLDNADRDRNSGSSSSSGCTDATGETPVAFRSLFPYFRSARALSGSAGLNPRSRRLLLTTKTELNAMAAPASIGFSRPAAASGSPATL